jgi:hypothetical protein
MRRFATASLLALALAACADAPTAPAALRAPSLDEESDPPPPPMAYEAIVDEIPGGVPMMLTGSYLLNKPGTNAWLTLDGVSIPGATNVSISANARLHQANKKTFAVGTINYTIGGANYTLQLQALTGDLRDPSRDGFLRVGLTLGGSVNGDDLGSFPVLLNVNYGGKVIDIGTRG